MQIVCKGSFITEYLFESVIYYMSNVYQWYCIVIDESRNKFWFKPMNYIEKAEFRILTHLFTFGIFHICTTYIISIHNTNNNCTIFLCVFLYFVLCLLWYQFYNEKYPWYWWHFYMSIIVYQNRNINNYKQWMKL